MVEETKEDKEKEEVSLEYTTDTSSGGSYTTPPSTGGCLSSSLALSCSSTPGIPILKTMWPFVLRSWKLISRCFWKRQKKTWR